MQKFYTVAIKNSFSILLLALGTLIRIKGGFVLLILYLKELVHEVKISVIFSNEIANYIILSKSLSAKTAMWNSNYLGCFKELLLKEWLGWSGEGEGFWPTEKLFLKRKLVPHRRGLPWLGVESVALNAAPLIARMVSGPPLSCYVCQHTSCYVTAWEWEMA